MKISGRANMIKTLVEILNDLVELRKIIFFIFNTAKFKTNMF